MKTGVFAYEQTVRNGTQGIGDTLFDLTAPTERGAPRERANMDYIGKYPDDPERVFNGEDSSLGVLAHEVGHRLAGAALFKDVRSAVASCWPG